MTRYARRQLYSLLIAAFFWACATTAFIVIPVGNGATEPVYKEIRIQLAPLEEKAPAPEPVKLPEPVIEEIAVAETPAPAVETPAPTPAPAPKAETAPKAAEPAPAAAPVKAAETVTPPPQAPAAKTPTPAPEPAKQTLVKSMDQLMAEQQASKGTKKSVEDVDWDAMFGESSTATSATSSGEKTFAAQTGSSLSGSAATTTTDTGTQATAVSGKSTDSTASAATASALGDIASSAGTGGTGSTSRGSVTGVPGGTGNAPAGSDGSGIEWGSGVGRKLIRPSTTVITLTPEQEALITASILNIRITFTVSAEGTVQRSSIDIDKKSSIPAAVTQEIERQISGWYFESGTSDGQAVFIYSIIKG